MTAYSLGIDPPAVAVTISDVATPASYVETQTDDLWLPPKGGSDAQGWQPSWAAARSFSDTLTISPTGTPLWAPAAFVSDMLALSPNLAPQLTYQLSYSDTLALLDALGTIVNQLMSEGLSLTEAWSVAQGVVLIDTLSLKPRGTLQMNYACSVAEAILLTPALQAFFALSYADTITLTPTCVDFLSRFASLSEIATLSDTWACSLSWNVVYDESVEIVDTDDVGAIYGWAIQEGIRIGIMFADPSGGLTTWAMNARTGAVTEYTNYGFNSFAQMGNKFLGASSSGLYELDGVDDNGTRIVARVGGGLLEFSGSRFTSFTAAYIGVRGPGDWFLKMIAGSGQEYVYHIRAHSLKTAKINLGKGLRSRYFRWELESAGQDFDLTSVEFLPISSVRRV